MGSDGAASPAKATQLFGMPLHLEQQQQQGDWESYIPTQYRHYFKRSAKNLVKAQKSTEASKSSAFLSGSADPVPMTGMPFLSGSVAGLALVLAMAARVTRRS